MSDNKIMDSSKYLEGNYSSNQFEAFFQKQEDSQQAFELNTLEVYIFRSILHPAAHKYRHFLQSGTNYIRHSI